MNSIELDHNNAIDYAKELSFIEAYNEGCKKGYKIGEYNSALRVASNMKKYGYALSMMIEFTELSVSEIENL